MKELHSSSVGQMVATKRRAAKVHHKKYVILCPASSRREGIIEALYALYYLPPNYTLRIEGAVDDMLSEVSKVLRHDMLAERIEWNTDETTETPIEASPFSFADVVVYGNARQVSDDTPAQSLVVFNLAGRQMTGDENHRFTVCANSSEALASAILQVTR